MKVFKFNIEDLEEDSRNYLSVLVLLPEKVDEGQVHEVLPKALGLLDLVPSSVREDYIIHVLRVLAERVDSREAFELCMKLLN